jgi:hypothetical protein
LGQSTLHDWPEKCRSVDEMSAHLRRQLADAPAQRWPENFTRWGGCKNSRIDDGTGYFRTYHDGHRWWLVDPDGYRFWSAGLDCIRSWIDAAYAGLSDALSWIPERTGAYATIFDNRGRQPLLNYLAANFIRTFGPDEWHDRWAEIALAELRRLGFNTVANWSEWEIARDAGFPYVRPLNLSWRRSKMVYRDFPDVFHPDFAADAADYAEQLRETADDPALIGYFLMNEPTWGFAQETPAAGMLFTTPHCATRQALRDFLAERYGTDAALADAWKMSVTLAEVADGEWLHALSPAAKADLADFSDVMVEKAVIMAAPGIVLAIVLSTMGFAPENVAIFCSLILCNIPVSLLVLFLCRNMLQYAELNHQ